MHADDDLIVLGWMAEMHLGTESLPKGSNKLSLVCPCMCLFVCNAFFSTSRISFLDTVQKVKFTRVQK